MIAVVPALIAGAASLAGGYLANRAGRKESQRNRDFQERMRGSQWQATVKDMEAAGINPAVAYSKGPNASASGSTATQSDVVTPAVSSAMQAAQMKQSINLMKEQIKDASNKAQISDDEMWWSKRRREFFDRFMGSNNQIKDLDGNVIASEGATKADRLAALLNSELGLKLATTAKEQSMANLAGVGGNVANMATNNLLPALGRGMGMAGRGLDSIATILETGERVGGMRDKYASKAWKGYTYPIRLLMELIRKGKNR